MLPNRETEPLEAPDWENLGPDVTAGNLLPVGKNITTNGNLEGHADRSKTAYFESYGNVDPAVYPPCCVPMTIC